MATPRRRASDWAPERRDPGSKLHAVVAVILDSITDGFFIFDRDSRLTYMNTAARKFATQAGRDPAGMVGKLLPDVIKPGIVDSQIASLLARVIDTRQAVSFEHFHTGWQRTFAVRLYPLPDGGTSAYIQDVTEQRRAEIEVRESEERFRTLADVSPLLVWSTGRDGRIEFVNAAWLEFFGVERARAHAFDWRAAIHPSDAPGYLAAFDDAYGGGGVFHARARFRRADAEWRWIESRANPRLDADGTVIGLVGSSPDITELIVAQTVLQEADRRKDEFLATLAHELRNPLAPICNSLELLRSPATTPASASQLRRIMERQARMLMRLVDDLLEVSRVTHGTIQLQQELISIASVVEEALDVSRSLIDADHHTLEVRLPDPGLEVWGDRTRLVQVVANLLNNAAKYTGRNGHITLSVKQENAEVVIAVKDTGIGIASDRLAGIFDFFARGEMPAGKVQSGLGVGLALARRLMDLHGGTVSASSDGPGLGSIFLLRLPLAHRAASLRPQPSPHQRPLPRRAETVA